MRAIAIATLLLAACGGLAEPDETAGLGDVTLAVDDDPEPDPRIDECLSSVTASFYTTPSVVHPGETTRLTWSVRAKPGCGGVTASISTIGSVPLSGSQTFVIRQDRSWGLTARFLGASRSMGYAAVTMAFPIVDGRPTVTISSQEQLPTFVQAIGTPNTLIKIPGSTVLDLSGRDFLHIAGGVHIIGDRSPYSLGPLLFTRTYPQRLFSIGAYLDADGVRISGLRLWGGGGPVPADEDAGGSVAISAYSTRNLEIDNNAIYGWRSVGVYVLDERERIQRSNASTVHIHDNSFFHNLRLGKDGYGVEVKGGAYALIERNWFNYNRHAIAAGGQSGTGYLARRNYVGPDGGENSGFWGTYTHQLDVHGLDDCFYGPLPYPWDKYCGQAGEYFEYRDNTVVYTEGTAIKVRGIPTEGAEITGNVFKHSDVWGGWIDAGAIVQTEGDNVAQWNNTFGFDPLASGVATCDFTGDGIPDKFMATGATWWWSPSELTPGERWFYLHASTRRLEELELRDADGDGRCDVVSPADGQVFPGGRQAPRLLYRRANSGELATQSFLFGKFVADWTSGGALDGSREVLATGDFDGDAHPDVVLRDVNTGAVLVRLMRDGVMVRDSARGSMGDEYVVGVADFDADGVDDLLWRHLDGRLELWRGGWESDQAHIGYYDAPGPGDLSWSVKGLGDFDGDGHVDILWRHSGGQVAIWLLEGTHMVADLYPGGSGGDANDWTIQGVGDFDHDNVSDILWRHAGGVLAIWFRGDRNRDAYPSWQNQGVPTGPEWQVRAVGDLNLDGRDDIVWRRDDGLLATWMMDGARFVWEPAPVWVDNGWHHAGFFEAP